MGNMTIMTALEDSPRADTAGAEGENRHMYLNRKNIELIKQVKARAERQGLVFAQTNSRLNGSYLSAARIYLTAADKGKATRAIWTGREPRDFEQYLTKRLRTRAKPLTHSVAS